MVNLKVHNGNTIGTIPASDWKVWDKDSRYGQNATVMFYLRSVSRTPRRSVVCLMPRLLTVGNQT
jgi:hypothetical protein